MTLPKRFHFTNTIRKRSQFSELFNFGIIFFMFAKICKSEWKHSYWVETKPDLERLIIIEKNTHLVFPSLILFHFWPMPDHFLKNGPVDVYSCKWVKIKLITIIMLLFTEVRRDKLLQISYLTRTVFKNRQRRKFL